MGVTVNHRNGSEAINALLPGVVREDFLGPASSSLAMDCVEGILAIIPKNRITRRGDYRIQTMLVIPHQVDIGPKLFEEIETRLDVIPEGFGGLGIVTDPAAEGTEVEMISPGDADIPGAEVILAKSEQSIEGLGVCLVPVRVGRKYESDRAFAHRRG
jgi:hypothetical protein